MIQHVTAIKAVGHGLKLAERKLYSIRRYNGHVRSQERLIVPCRSNGEISLDVYHPLAQSTQQDVTPRVLIYLPRGPLRSDGENENATASELGQHLPSHHVIRINYRLSIRHQYPTPAHDTLTAFDWIRDNVLPKRAISRPGRPDRVGRIGVCGELIGGGLASMLALTECRAGEPGIAAAAINNPVVDWVSLDHAARSTTDDDSRSVAERLLRLRSQLFPKPDKYFDPFASPMLLFRTSGVEVPPALADLPLDDMEQLSLYEREVFARQNMPNASGFVQEGSDQIDLPLSSPAPRKASRRYPSASLNLRLPSFHIASGSLQPFHGQASELAHVIRQSLVRQARQSATGSSFGRKVLLDDEEDKFEDEGEKAARLRQKAEAEAKAVLERNDGWGSWDGSAQGRERVARVAKWIGEKMGQAEV